MGSKPFSWLFPTPIDLFSGLKKRWELLGGPSLPDRLINYIEGGGCLVSRYDLQTIESLLQERTQIGFVGSLVIETSPAESDCASALVMLGKLAFFTGLGYQTARGMGCVYVKSGFII